MTTLPPRHSYDAIVVGARCAGAATAMLMARRGLRVLAVERSRYGSDTLSTHALMRGAVSQLRRWELLDRLTEDTPPIRTTSFHYGDNVVELDIKPRDGVDALYAPRRTVLDPLLVDAAIDAGADVVHGVRLVDVISSTSGRLRGVVLEDSRRRLHQVEAGIVIGADGAGSTLAGLVGAGIRHRGRHATANIYGYWSGLEMDGYHWYFRPGVSVGAIPTNGNLVCIFASMPTERFHNEIRSDLSAGYHRVVVESAPELAAALGRATRAGTLRGFAGRTGFIRQSWGPGWALVGDAGYFKDPLTAHGITDALRDAELLSRAVAEDSDRALADYQDTRDALSLGLFRTTDAIASFEWDLAGVRKLHLQLSAEMAREVDALYQLDRPPAIAARLPA